MPLPFNSPVTLVVKVTAGVVVAFATVPANPLAETTDIVVTVPDPLPAGAAHVPSAFKYFPAAASPAAGAGTNPATPPAPLSPTIAACAVPPAPTCEDAAAPTCEAVIPVKLAPDPDGAK